MSFIYLPLQIMNNKTKLNPNCLVRPQYRSYSQYIKELAQRPTHFSTEEEKQYDEIWNRHANDEW